MKNVTLKDIKKNRCILTPSQLKVLSIPNENTIMVKDFMRRDFKSSDKGTEVGSINYIRKSDKFFIRAKTLQKNSFLIKEGNNSIIPIRPQVFKTYNLKEGDLLISKDSNIGESAILDKDYTDYMISGALYNLPIKSMKYYLFAFLKHHYFKEQIDLIVPKGATMRHAKTRFLECKIPLPNQETDKTIKYVEKLTISLINKEKKIRDKNKLILEIIDIELKDNQKKDQFTYKFPKISDMNDNKRINGAFYSIDFERMKFLITNYKNGYSTLDKQGFTLIPGPSLELKLLGTRINSLSPKENFYRLITPTQMSNYGTIDYYQYLGTSCKIPELKFGDIVFGESGTGRSFVYMDIDNKTITNAHGHVLRPNDISIEKTIAIRCILSYLKSIGFIDYMTVGGSGGHLSPSYFDRVLIPTFSKEKQIEISKLYHNKKKYPKNVNLDNFSNEDEKWNDEVGIMELDESYKIIKNHLNKTLDKIINNEKIEMLLNF